MKMKMEPGVGHLLGGWSTYGLMRGRSEAEVLEQEQVLHQPVWIQIHS